MIIPTIYYALSITTQKVKFSANLLSYIFFSESTDYGQPVVLDKSPLRVIIKVRLCKEGGDVGGNDPLGRDSVRRWCSGVKIKKVYNCLHAEAFRRVDLSNFRRNNIKSMKSKLFKVLGVVAIVAMLASSLVAPAAALSGLSVSVTSGTAIINAVGNYTVTANLGEQLLGANAIPETLPTMGDPLTFTAVNAYDMVKVAFTGATPSVVTTGGGHYSAGVVSFTALPGTVTFTSQAANTVITYTETAGSAATVTPPLDGTAGTAFPNGDTITLTFPTGFTISAPTGTSYCTHSRVW